MARLRDALKEGAAVYYYQMMDIHAGGHAQQEDLKLLFFLVRPAYIAPIRRTLLPQRCGVGGETHGYDDKHVMTPLNGQVMELAHGEVALTKFASQQITSLWMD